MLNLVVSKEFICINGVPFCVDDYVNKCCLLKATLSFCLEPTLLQHSAHTASICVRLPHTSRTVR